MENIDGWERLMECHPFIVEMCGVMLFGSEHYPMYSDGFSAEECISSFEVVETFSLIHSMVVLYRVLTYFRESMRKLQGISQDLSSGLRMIKDCHSVTIHNNRRTDGIFRSSL